MAWPDNNIHPIVGGVQANLWAAAATGAAGKSATFDTAGLINHYFHGNVSGATNLTVETSADGTTWNATSFAAVAANGDFGFSFTGGSKFLRLSSSANVTATATATAKG